VKRPEQSLQKSIVTFIRTAYPRAVCFHVPNGGGRSKIEAAIFKSIGVMSGVADLCILWKGGHVGFIEVKAGKGKLSENQLKFMDHCVRLGIPWECVNSLEQAQSTLKHWGVS